MVRAYVVVWVGGLWTRTQPPSKHQHFNMTNTEQDITNESRNNWSEEF